MIIIVELRIYARKVIVLAVSREYVFHVDAHKGVGDWSHVDRGRRGSNAGFSCGRNQRMTPRCYCALEEFLFSYSSKIDQGRL